MCIRDRPQSLIDELYQGAYQFKENHKSTNVSNKGGYQTPTFDWKYFHPQGTEYINKIVDDIFTYPGHSFSVKVESWWYNINGKGHWNIPHTHPNSDFALVLYLTDSDGLLNLMSPFPQRNFDYNGGHISVDANKGDIVMFPSDINHYVLPNPREEDRVSISMNLQLC